jgi:hypothetical protein
LQPMGVAGSKRGFGQVAKHRAEDAFAHGEAQTGSAVA